MRVEPNPEDPEAITEALFALRNGAPDAMDRLAPLVYEQLKRIARRQLRAEPPGHTLSTTALVHEAYLKLVDQTRAEWQDRGHFYAVASGAMRRILVDYARRYTRRAPWRRGRWQAGATDHARQHRNRRMPNAPTYWSRWTRRSSGSVGSMSGKPAWWNAASSEA